MILFVFASFTRLLFLAMTKYVTESSMKIMMTRRLAVVDETYSLYTINDCNSGTLDMGRCNKREYFPGQKTGVQRSLTIKDPVQL